MSGFVVRGWKSDKHDSWRLKYGLFPQKNGNKHHKYRIPSVRNARRPVIGDGPQYPLLAVECNMRINSEVHVAVALMLCIILILFRLFTQRTYLAPLSRHSHTRLLWFKSSLSALWFWPQNCSSYTFGWRE